MKKILSLSLVFCLVSCDQPYKDEKSKPNSEIVLANGLTISPDFIYGKTITLSAGGSSSVTTYGDSTIQDIAKAIIPYSYEKTGETTGRIVIRMSLEYSTRDDVEYLLTFESNDIGTIYYTQGDLKGTFTIR